MKHLKLLLAALGSIAIVFAQTFTSPVKVDWRYKFSWEDPNPPGSAVSWNIYASNSPANVRIMQVSNMTTIELKTVLNGAPAGIYAVFNTAVSDLGDVSTQSTNIYVRWPGGDGKISPGRGLGATR